MGRPLGSLNRMTREKDQAQKSLVKKYGLSPLESILQKRKRWEDVYDEQMSRSSRHRNVHKIKEAEEWILKYNVEALPYTAPKYQSIQVASEVKQLTAVIRAPQPESNNEAWLAKYKPKQIDANPQPAAPALRQYVREIDEARDALEDADSTIRDLNRRMGGH